MVLLRAHYARLHGEAAAGGRLQALMAALRERHTAVAFEMVTGMWHHGPAHVCTCCSLLDGPGKLGPPSVRLALTATVKRPRHTLSDIVSCRLLAAPTCSQEQESANQPKPPPTCSLCCLCPSPQACMDTTVSCLQLSTW